MRPGCFGVHSLDIAISDLEYQGFDTDTLSFVVTVVVPFWTIPLDLRLLSQVVTVQVASKNVAMFLDQDALPGGFVVELGPWRRKNRSSTLEPKRRRRARLG